MEQVALHPLCTLFPRLAGAEFEALRDDIATNGLREPIVMHDGMILDGGNRYRACLDAGVEPSFVKFNGGNLVSFVLSANLHRRHMSPGQHAAIVASAQDWAKAQTRGGDRKSDQSATLHLDSVEKRAAEAGASIRTQKMADKVARKSPSLAKRVAHGEISLPKAHQQVSKPSKILPRKVPQAKVAPKEDPKAAARVAELEEENKALKLELRESRENANELGESLQAFVSAEEGTVAAAKEIKRLLGVVRVTEATRDQYMTKCNELVRTVKSLQRKVEKLEGKK